MKLKNKKTGEIKNAVDIDMYTDSVYLKVSTGEFDNETIEYHSLAELNEEWEDAPEEPKEHWCITMYGGITHIKDDEEPIDDLIEIGNYFNSKEDAYDAWDKLKAWKRLKDKGFRFIGKTYETDKRFGSVFYKVDEDTYSEDIMPDLDSLFGGEE